MGGGMSITLMLILPLVGVIFSFLLSSKYTGFSAVIFSTLLSIASLFLLISITNDPYIYRFVWLPNMELGFHIGRLNAVLMVLVSFISLLVQVFSLTYMENDLAVKRYFSLLLFFTFSMLGLLAADHLILLFIFWELVGVSSYFLIGFWFQKTENALAARKAFIVNRIADVALLSGIILLWVNDHTLFISGFATPQTFTPWIILAGFGILIGAMAKSAQFPFFTWLPAAMAGPTPVSALIHAATMVAAGVYLLAMTAQIFAPGVMLVMVVVGTVTALLGALVAVFQSDIKKVLAYSTVSQLGYMVLAIGVSSTGSALFHLWTHAFFKAGLFLAAGSVIHALHHLAPDIDAQDMSKMGGLKRVIPYTFYTFLICAAALVGLPFFTGFLSKDAILIAAWNWSSINAESMGNFVFLVPIVGLLVVFLTALYMFRQVSFVFLGKNRSGAAIHMLKEPISIKIALIALSAGSLGFWYHINPFAHNIQFVSYFFGSMTGQGSVWVPAFSIVSAVLGIGIAFWLFNPARNIKLTTANQWQISIKEAFWIERFYDTVIVGAYNGISGLVRVFDLKVVDRMINFAGVLFVVFAKLMDLIDKLVVDGLVKMIAKTSSLLGQLIRSFQSYRVQLHFFWALAGLLLLFWWLNDWMI